jgi:protein-disulfide isomerase
MTLSEPSPIVATFGARTLRQAEVDLKAKDELTKLNEQIYDLRVETAEQLAIESLIAQKAKVAGLPDAQWLEKQVETPSPAEPEIREMYERLKGRIPAGKTFDDVKSELTRILQKDLQSKKAKVLFAQLKKEANFTLLLKPAPRSRVIVDETGPTRGDPKAKITIVEFADFQCSYCAQSVRTVENILKTYEGRVKLVFKHFPLSFHEKAPKAAEAAACADEQGKFWAMHDSLFDTLDLDIDALKGQAATIGLDAKKFDACLDSGRLAAVVKRDQLAGQKAGVNGTPAFYINGIGLSGAKPEEDFVRVIEEELVR